MNLIQRLKIWSELRRLETRVHENPCPATFVDLGQVYINLGMHDKTLQLAEEGLALFPQSDELRKLKRFAQKTQLSDRIDQMRSQLAKAKEPGPYHELAQLHLELGDLESVQGVCEECIRRFPDDAEAHLLLARASLLSFYRDLGARDGSAAVDHLHEVLRLGGDIVGARRLLAELAWRIGSTNQVLEQLGALDRMGVTDSDLQSMRDALSAGEGELEIGEDEDLAALFHGVEAQGRLVRAPVSRERKPSAPVTEGEALQSVRDGLARLAGRRGVEKATFIRGAKAFVKGGIRDGRDPFLRVVRVVARASQRAAKRMDVGNFSKGYVDGNFGRICVCSFGEALAAVQCGQEVDPAAILEELQELVASTLVAVNGRRS